MKNALYSTHKSIAEYLAHTLQPQRNIRHIRLQLIIRQLYKNVAEYSSYTIYRLYNYIYCSRIFALHDYSGLIVIYKFSGIFTLYDYSGYSTYSSLGEYLPYLITAEDSPFTIISEYSPYRSIAENSLHTVNKSITEHPLYCLLYKSVPEYSPYTDRDPIVVNLSLLMYRYSFFSLTENLF